YATLDDLPTTGLTSGDQAYVSATSRFYISNGSGWYNVALVNATPNLTISPTGEIELSREGATTTITLTGTDSDYPDANLTYSVESDGSFAGMASISQDSSVFTITPLSEDSATTTSSTLTFKASDGVSFGSGDRTLTLIFSIENSNYTSFLLKADASKSDAQTDLSSNSSTIGEVNQVYSYSYSPYHPGGYSYYFAGDGGDYFTIQSPTSALNFGTGDFCIEMWVHPFDTGTFIWADMRPDDTNNDTIGAFSSASGNPIVYINNTAIISTSGSPLSAGEWHHLVLNRDGTDMSIFVDGVREGTATNSTNLGVGKFRLFYAAFQPGGGVQDGGGGYVRDYRVVKGNSVYGSGTTLTVPTKPLTAISGTSLLLFQKPYLKDEVGTETISFVGGEKRRISPYDHIEYDRTTHGGSVYLYGTDDYFTVDGGYLTTNTTWWNSSGFTLEVWLYKTNTNDEHTIWDNRQSGNANGFLFRIRSGGLYLYSNNAERAADLGINIVNQWQHVALVCSGTTGKIFQNGVQVGSDFTVPDTASHTYFGRSQNTIGAIQYTPRGAGTEYVGYMSDFRISSGSRYTGTFTPPTEAFANDGTTVFLTFKNQNNIWNTGLHSTPLVKQNNVTASNTQRKFTTSSAIYFDGNADYVYESWSDRTDLVHNIPWTIEGWFRFDNVTTDQHFIHAYANGGAYDGYALTLGSSSNPGTTLCFWDGAAWRTFKSDMAINTWYHIAVVNDGTNAKVYVDGTQSGSTFTPSSQIKRLTSVPLSIGCYYNGVQAMAGYAQDVRISKGVA
ncbi:MAG: LamG-like jellyroll fold domain-containing protein, partial [Candidatus Neomarinimicrobiota bacterium]